MIDPGLIDKLVDCLRTGDTDTLNELMKLNDVRATVFRLGTPHCVEEFRTSGDRIGYVVEFDQYRFAWFFTSTQNARNAPHAHPFEVPHLFHTTIRFHD